MRQSFRTARAPLNGNFIALKNSEHASWFFSIHYHSANVSVPKESLISKINYMSSLIENVNAE